VERVWRAIESGVFYPAPSTVTCASCGYRAACRVWVGWRESGTGKPVPLFLSYRTTW